MWARLILVVAGAVTALFVARDTPNFPVVEGMVGVVLVAAVVVGLALFRRR